SPGQFARARSSAAPARRSREDGMLVCFWSPKGGSGTSTVAAVAALVSARAEPTRLVDLAGDQPALLGLASDPPTGAAEWLAAGAGASADALDRIALDVHRDLTLVPRGAGDPRAADPEAGAALGVSLRDDARPTVADAGHLDADALDALAAVADASVVVVRGCYLALRRAVRHPATARAAGVVLLEESGRALGAKEVADVVGLPLLASIPVRASISRVVDAGVLAARMPDGLTRPMERALERLGLRDRRGRAA
ncbi:MAG TPA: hypothetical protein VFZ83_08625, partial [Acidimicrobiia bacterium]|nr:hypothetical protein [Acidimicrobiia bacterium]